ncbi:MAG: pyridine nucleotide-disulfide oxidoreductase [Cyanobacteria bacterium SIG26]|nr:pyridine nucleotide-disulfide oxidoreductase [Cyanobacteria bacterium SIG26]
MNIVIIGGVAAGAKAAAKIKRLLPDSNVSIYTDDTHVSYSSCGLPYYIEGNFEDYKALLVRSVEEFKASGIDVFLETKIDKILPKQRQVLACGKDKAWLIDYDRLIIATGARPFIPNIKGVNDFDNIYTLRKIEDGINIRNKMLNSKKVVIIGSGFIGLELLEAFVKNGLEVVVLEKGNHIISSFDADMSLLIRERLESIPDRNFLIQTGEIVSEVTGTNGLADTVKTLSGKEFKTDFVVICAGIIPNSELAKNAGLEIGESGAIKVNKLMQTSEPNIYACGDCCEEPHIISGHSVWVPLGSTANKEGRCAALNAAGVYTIFEGVLGSAVSRCLNTTMSMTGLTEKEAIEFGFTPVSATVSKYDKVAYMPDVGEITLKVVADKATGLLLGGQAIGSLGADKRINTLASALLGHLTVHQFKNNDLTYSPPYSPTIDPLLDAMNILCGKITRRC